MKYLKLKEIAKLKNGKKCNYDVKGIIPVYGSNGIIGYTDNLNSPENSIIIGRVGANAGSVFYSFKKHWVTDNAISVVPNINKINSFYLYYALYSLDLNRLVEGSAQPLLNQSILNSLEIRVPPLSVQNSIVEKIRAFDEKIAVNNQINDNLLELNNKVFSKIFCDEKKFIEAQKIANIKIGKTPPRKEKNWFSSKGITWVSISDMKTNVPFINSSKEQISLKAIKKFNITKVKPKTIILSFKLTIGRVKIASSTLTTNEAIVEFNDAQLPYQFLYSYLKKFNFEALGNTSSIAKALNSKIIKKMPIMLPSRKSLNKYILFSTPIFHFLEEKQIENSILNNVKRELLQQYF